MKILHIINQYGALTGSEMYVYELSREQAKKNKVFIQSDRLIDGELIKKTLKNGVRVIGPNKKPKIDIIHAHQAYSVFKGLVEYEKPVVQTVHSEILPKYEFPVKCSGHIAVRPAVKTFVEKSGFNCELIFNPFDFTRFMISNKKESKPPVVLFAGPKDYLREKAIAHLEEQDKNGDIKLVGVGRGWETEPIFEIEKLVADCDYVAGVMMGRSTVEGWLCGKPAIIYDVDPMGKINEVRLIEPPRDLSRFDSKVVTDQVERFYEKCLR